MTAAISKAIWPIDGPTLQAKAKEFAAQLQIPNFAASNGWLESFEFNICLKVFNGESLKELNKEVVEYFRSKLAALYQGYNTQAM